MAHALISLGSNLGDRARTLDEALARLQANPEIQVVERSRFLSTQSVGGPGGQAEFLNAAARLETTHDPPQLLDRLLRMEADLGRQRNVRWEARSLDLDLLLHDAHCIRSPDLTVPHPRMTFRRFVLEPAAEVAGDMIHPPTGWSVRQLLDHLNQAPDYLAVATAADYSQRSLVQAAAEATGAQAVLTAQASSFVKSSPPEDWDSADSSSRTSMTGLEWLRGSAEQIRAALASPPGRAVISDVWFEQLASEFTNSAADKATAEAMAAHLPPKLLVLIDPPTDDPSVAARAAALRERVLAGYRRPVLHLETADPDLILAELIAALTTFRRLAE